MDNEIAEKILVFMNLAEKRYDKPDMKQDFVVRSIQHKYPDLSDEEIKDLIEVFINVSKLTTKMLFNTLENGNCCSIS